MQKLGAVPLRLSLRILLIITSVLSVTAAIQTCVVVFLLFATNLNSAAKVLIKTQNKISDSDSGIGIGIGSDIGINNDVNVFIVIILLKRFI